MKYDPSKWSKIMKYDPTSNNKALIGLIKCSNTCSNTVKRQETPFSLKYNLDHRPDSDRFRSNPNSSRDHMLN